MSEESTKELMNQIDEQLIKQSENIKRLNQFNDYFELVKSTKDYPEEYAVLYPVLGLTGKTGGIAKKIEDWLAGKGELNRHELLTELGSPLYYIAALADDLGFTLQDVVDRNQEELNKKKKEKENK